MDWINKEHLGGSKKSSIQELDQQPYEKDYETDQDEELLGTSI
jgi:hypothetical protein